MEADRQMKLDALKARISRRDYEVDPDAVAEAIVRRVLVVRREVCQGRRAINGYGSPLTPGDPLGAA